MNHIHNYGVQGGFSTKQDKQTTKNKIKMNKKQHKDKQAYLNDSSTTMSSLKTKLSKAYRLYASVQLYMAHIPQSVRIPVCIRSHIGGRPRIAQDFTGERKRQRLTEEQGRIHFLPISYHELWLNSSGHYRGLLLQISG